MNQIPRSEYPRPSFVKNDWMNLNGPWQFAIDFGDTGENQGWVEKEFDGSIIVPFCPESELSGIGNTDFLNAVWYRRKIEIPANWAGKRILLHFQAVDFDTTVWIDGVESYRHRGGFTPFTLDLGILSGESFTVVVRARDPKFRKPAGKQSDLYATYGCRYTRTTGIWQTVWMEAVSDVYMKRPRITPQRGSKSFMLEVPLSANRPGYKVQAELRSNGKVIATAEAAADTDMTPVMTLNVPAEDYREWCIEDPYLYDIDFFLLDNEGKTVEKAACYAGMRSVAIDGNKFLINGKPVFQRLVLDQGYYKDGILTAPSEEALINDIKLSMAAGFNGARLHEKVFEERFLYHADRMGYLVWGEFADWGFERSYFSFAEPVICQPVATLIAQWLEALERDYSHPSIIGWCAVNESGQRYYPTPDNILALDDALHGCFLAAKAADRTRPVLDSSGWSHRVRETDVYDTHDYEQDPEKFAEHYKDLYDHTAYNNMNENCLKYNGQPFFNSEFGGIRWNPAKASGDSSWGYGQPPQTIEEFYKRFEGLVSVLLNDERMFGYCYTQLTDVFIEENGIYYFDRTPKFDMKRICEIQSRIAAYEKILPAGKLQ